ncbi:di-heme oxidoredictase family protein [Pasteurella atlantica]|uniref:di-heme oxidoredictase family protein n=1 Tax=Pasteurellaceae TaxID=712 RepID=UPI002749540F|nr:di-heme oxidoredictase family protein [Pasteurella atlantica]MDP8034504.1 di-heme oxidoredictase family protein [Pasteurella atlantica]MDP8036436.1 di-heme oxidoredictase family protein [Pasteurella atlantica]MDP8038389.1 di-heme oxidoredictase family protein [Pasteurella atlantica]MDP8048701.1 di-heme oxidoredictase family protein [Pasteurella atlantica]MDP8050644.1 di-heme oxidoredictase family protein [Pasteurella atlantica]
MSLHHYNFLSLIIAINIGLPNFGFAEHSTSIDPELLNPIVSQKKEKDPERWFETKNSRNTFPLKHQINGLDYDEEDLFTIGRSFFTIPWVAAPSATTARDGLGPLFSANTCVSCHGKRNFGYIKNEQGHINRALAFKFVNLSKTYDFNQTFKAQYTDPIYGGQLSINGNSGAPFEAKPQIEFETRVEQFDDGTKVTLQKPIATIYNENYGKLAPQTHISLRMAPMLAGMGLIEALTDEQIIANEDPNDRDNDGISGRVNWVYHPYTHQKMVGRFGLKAQAPTLAVQTADAAAHDMGLTNRFFPKENCMKAQTECLNAPIGRPSPEGLLDLPDLRLKGIAFYVAHLKAPKQRPKDQFVEGYKLFNDLGCISCHKENWTTPSGIAFSPFSDFLIHDMGEGLADKRNEYTAQGVEWRTQPLWGLGIKLRAKLGLLHDGRAKTIEQAVFWHDGEAKEVKKRFKALPKEQRQQLIEFLENL